jgi:uncharacterized protein (DUF305 family)
MSLPATSYAGQRRRQDPPAVTVPLDTADTHHGVLAVGYWRGNDRRDASRMAGYNSAEAGFARDMAVHHAQAVEMAS